MKTAYYFKSMIAALLLISTMSALAGDQLENAIAELQHGWAKVLYQTPQTQKEVTYQDLVAQAKLAVTNFPGRVEPMVWEAIILSSYAGFVNGLGSLGNLQTAKELLLSAEQMDPTAMGGMIPMVLGVIHYKAPHWPISFGENGKARTNLEAALQYDPDGIDSNFYYGEFLVQQREFDNARTHLEKALAAAPRPGREDADEGRKAEIGQLLKDINR